MSRRIAFALILLAAALVWLFTRSGEEDDAGVTGLTTKGPETFASAQPLDAGTQLERAKLESPLPEPEDTTQPSVGTPSGVRLQGRCVAAEDGTPLAGIEIRAYGRPMPERRATDPVWQDPETLRTGADGRFTIDFPPAVDCELILLAQDPDLVRQRREWKPGVANGTVLDVGDLLMARGAAVSGRIEDETGQPVPRLYLRLEPEFPVATADGNGLTIGTRADDAGAFEFPSAARSGPWRFGISSGSCTIESPESITVSEGLAPLDVLLKVRMREAIRGVVEDASGTPIPGVTIAALESQGYRREQTTTREDGTFALYKRESETDPSALEISGPAVQPMKLTSHFPWNSEGHRIQAERSLTTAIRVVERGTGMPVEHYGVRIARKSDASDLSGLRHDGNHPEGRLLLDGLQRGDNYVVVLPENRSVFPNYGAKVIGGLEEEVTIELQRAQPFQVLVCLADGTPVAGSRVRLFDQRLRHESLWLDPFNTSRSIEGVSGLARLLSEQMSGLNGLVTLGVPPSEEDVFLQASGSHTPKGEDLIRPLTLEQPYRLVVNAGGVIRGTVLLPEGQAEKFTIVLKCVRDGVNRVRAGPHQPEVLGADGSFRFEGLTPNTYWVHLATNHRFQRKGSADVYWREMEEPMMEILLAAGEDRVLTLDASDFAFGEMEATFLVDGEAAPSTMVSVVRRPAAHQRGVWTAYGAFRTDTTGKIRCEDLVPGHYRATLLLESELQGPLELISENEVEIRAGSLERMEFRFRSRGISFQFLDEATGAPLADRVCFFNFKSGSEPPEVLHDSYAARKRTDVSGIIVLHGLIAGRYVVSVMGTGTTSLTEEFEIPDVVPEGTVVLRASPIR